MQPPEQLKKTADALIEGCRNGHEKENLGKLYHPQAVSVEAYPGSEGMGREVQGVDAIRAKHDWWESTYEQLGGEVHGPFLHGDDRFSAVFEMKTKHKETGEVEEMKETATYHVDGDGKITREEFFYAM